MSKQIHVPIKTLNAIAVSLFLLLMPLQQTSAADKYRGFVVDIGAADPANECSKDFPASYPVITTWAKPVDSLTFDNGRNLYQKSQGLGPSTVVIGDIHTGEDYIIGAGTDVMAVADGWVDCSFKNVTKGGGTVFVSSILPGSNTPVTIMYMHLAPASLVAKGTKVTAGVSVIGKIGTTAENGGWLPHLHIGIRNGYFTSQDPAKYKYGWPNVGWGYQVPTAINEISNWKEFSKLYQEPPKPTPQPYWHTVTPKLISIYGPWWRTFSTCIQGRIKVFLDQQLLFYTSNVDGPKPTTAATAWLNPIWHTIGIQYFGSADLGAPNVDYTTWPTPVACGAGLLVNPPLPAPGQPQPPVGASPPSGNLAETATYMTDVTLPDGTVLEPAKAVTKSWRVRNSGGTTWGSGYRFVFVSGDRLGGADINAPLATPGATVDINVGLTAPSSPGDYLGFWQLQNTQGTRFGPKLSVKLTVRVPVSAPVNSSLGNGIAMFDVAPASPSSAANVHLVGRVQKFTEFRAMRFVVGNQTIEMPNFQSVGDQFEISTDWATTSLARGNYSILLEVARVGDNSWSNPWRQIKPYTLTGTPVATNRPPPIPVLQGPYNWFLSDAGGASASLQLCANAVMDPDGSAVQYYFEVTGATNYNSGWVSGPCWAGSFSPATYSWRVKARDAAGAESGWSTETWNFSIASGGVSVGGVAFYQLGTNDTHFCVPVTYGGTIAPDVTAFINLATDGSENGAWKQLDHYGPNAAPDCTASNTHGFWVRSPNYESGRHAIRINAVKRDNGASATSATFYDIGNILPPSPQAISPSSVNNNDTWWNVWNIPFAWTASLRASSYTLKVSKSQDPLNDPFAVVNMTFGPGTTSITVPMMTSLNETKLYWAVRASNAQGNADSAVASFGLDIGALPSCSVAALQSVLFDNVIPIQWSGSDGASGVRSYDVQVRDSQRGDWLDWLVDTGAVLGQFIGQAGHTYEFRCRGRDIAGNIGNFPLLAQTATKVDPTARPPEPWWSTEYSGKRGINVQNTMPSATLPAGYPVVYRISGATAADIYNASQSTPKCNDLRVVYNNTTQLDRLVTQCSNSAIEIWFRNQTPVAPNSSSSVHQLYFGNASAGSPPSLASAVWQPTVDGNTVAMYYFQEGNGGNTTDASGNNRNCSINASVQWAPAKFGQGLRFNRANAGDSRSLNCGTVPALTAFTIDFWYNPDSDGDGRIAGALGGNGNGGGNNWVLANFEGHIRIDIWPQNEVRSNFNLRDAQYVGKWHHIAVTFNGANEVRFYIDGNLDSVKNLSGNGINTYPTPLEIGSSEGIGQLKGNLGAFRVSNIVRTDFAYGAMAGITSEPNVALGSIVAPPIVGTRDLAVLDMQAYPNVGGGTAVQVTVQNQGTLPTDNGFYTDLYADHLPSGAGDTTGSVHFWVNDPILSGQVVTLTTVLNGVQGTNAAQHRLQSTDATQEVSTTLYVQTNSSGSFAESQSGNNKLVSGMSVCLASNDAYEPDDGPSAASSLQLNVVQHHNLSGAADGDWAKMDLQAGRTYRLRTSNLGSAADTYLYLYSVDGVTLLAANDDVDESLASQLVYTAIVTGTYYVQVRHWNPSAGGCQTTYDLDVSEIDLMLPSVSWSSPISNSAIYTTTGGSISLSVLAMDNVGVQRVAFVRWDVTNLISIPIATVTSAPYVTSLDASILNMGSNRVSAIATDIFGNQREESVWIYRASPSTPTQTPLPVTTTLTPGGPATATSTPMMVTSITPTALPTSRLVPRRYLPLIKR